MLVLKSSVSQEWKVFLNLRVFVGGYNKQSGFYFYTTNRMAT